MTAPASTSREAEPASAAPAAPVPRTGGAERVVTIDGLRGLAATLVVLYHLHEAIARTTSDWLWAPVDWIARNGFLGVDIFFVISGFVIALSVSRGAPTLGYFGRFILRRSIRLDPPYWSSILLEILLLHLTLRFFSGVAVALPTAPQLVAHLFYAQELLGYGSVVPIYWTLCYEIQFYAFFVSLAVLHAWLPRGLQRAEWLALGSGGLFLFSLAMRFSRPEWLPQGLAIDRWFQFFIGALTHRAVSAPGRMPALMAAWVGLGIAILASGASVTQFLPVIVSGWLVLCSRQRRWGWLFTTRPFRFLGAISYSIYLYHASVGWRFVSLMQRLLPGPWSPPVAVAVYLVGAVGSIAFAALLWRFVERPCLRLCQRVRLPLRTPAAEPAAALATR